jgi:hypothetical protein
MLVFAVSLTFCLVTATSDADEVRGWKKPLREKERLLEANILKRHNILGLYPSMVQIPPVR